MNNRTLGYLGLIGAPIMMIGMVLMMKFPDLKNTSFNGLHGLIFMLSWTCILVGLMRLNVTGNSVFGRVIIRANLVTITLANIWNVYQAIEPGANTPIYWFLDAFWPISMITMLPVGITVALVGTLRGWRRYVPLMAGLNMPLTALLFALTDIPFLMDPSQQSDVRMYILTFTGSYITVCWSLMAYIVRTTPQPEWVDHQQAVLN
jgi:hypothetical protein